MIIIIAGPPKIGKSIIAKHLSQKLGWFHLCTDDLVSGIKTIIPFNINNPLFANDQHELADLNGYYAFAESQVIIDNYVSSYQQINKVVVGFLDSMFRHREQNIIIEGVGMLPNFFASDFWQHYPIKYFSFGNLNFNQSIQNPSLKPLIKTGWLTKLDDRALTGFSRFVEGYSQLFKQQCQQKNLFFSSLNSFEFKKQVEEAEQLILKQIKTAINK